MCSIANSPKVVSSLFSTARRQRAGHPCSMENTHTRARTAQLRTVAASRQTALPPRKKLPQQHGSKIPSYCL